jgi:phosphate transport system substrate-binding protein
LLIGGASAMYDVNVALGKAFEKRHGIKVIVEGGGSLPGLLAARRHAIDIAAMARDLEADEAAADAHIHLIARDAIAVVVHPRNPLRQLRRDVVHAILNGKIDHWRAVGGTGPIDVVARPRGHPTSRYVSEVVLGGGDLTLKAQVRQGGDELLDFIGNNPAAIGCVATDDGAIPSQVVALAVDDVPITRETVLSGRYPYSRSLHLLVYGQPQREVRDFIAFAESPEGQAIVDALGFLPVR